MSLRLRLLLIIGSSLLALWCAASLWLFVNLRQEFSQTLDERLAASAQMAAELVGRFPQGYNPGHPTTLARPDRIDARSVACEIRMLTGDLVATTENAPPGIYSAKDGYGTIDIRGASWRTYSVIHNGMKITAADRLERRHSLLRDILLTAVLPFLIAAVGSLIALWIGVRHGLQPLEGIRRHLASRQPDVLAPLPTEQLPTELLPMVSAMNALLLRMEQAITRERSFSSNAAHELRTPLTGIRTHIQVAKMVGNSEVSAHLEQAELGALRLQNILEQLLMLARVEGPFDFDADAPVSAVSALQIALQQLDPGELARISITDGPRDVLVSLPGLLLTTALRNLVDNALRHSPPGSPVHISTVLDNAHLGFRIRNNASRSLPLDQDLMQRRFWRNGLGHGSGLGLSIVAAICSRYEGHLDIATDGQDHTVARLSFPVA